jgi:hypothetical protein
MEWPQTQFPEPDPHEKLSNKATTPTRTAFREYSRGPKGDASVGVLEVQ